MSTTAASRPARRRLGAGESVSALLGEVRQSARGLRKAAGLTTTVTLILALGIGATTTVFGIVSSVLLQPLPYPDPERLVRIYRDHPPNRWPLAVVDYEALRDQQTHFERVAAYRDRLLTFHRGDVAERIAGQQVTPGYFALLGIPMLMGRGLVEADGVSGGPPTVVVSHGFWRQRLEGDSEVLGSQVSLDGNDHTVVGVLPPRAGPLQQDREVFAILQLAPPTRRGPFFLRVLGRLEPGVARSAAAEEVRAINDRLFPIWQSSYPDATVSFAIEGLREYVVGEAGVPLWILLAAVGLLWLVSSTNAAGLLIASLTRRDRELAVRSALGASRARLLRQLLLESLLLGGAGAALGLALATVALRVVAAASGDVLPRVAEIGISDGVVAFAVVVTTATVLLFGLIPAVKVVGAGIWRAVAVGGRQSSVAGAQHVRRLLVATQFAVAVPLLVGAGLLMSSFLELRKVDPGFAPEGLLTLYLPLARSAYPEPEDARRFWSEAGGRVAALPGVVATGAGTGRPPAEYPFENNFNLEDRPTPADRPEPTCPWTVVDAGYFQTVGIRLLAGRLFDERDRAEATTRVVVDSTWARRFYPGEEVVGRRMTSGGCNRPDCPRLEVIGVVDDVRYTGLDDPGRGVVYLAEGQIAFWQAYLFVRSESDPLSLLPAIRSIVRDLDPALPMTRIATMEELIYSDLAPPRNLLALFGAFAGSALLLAVVGIYGVMSYFVQRHSKEIGIRIAIGCTPGSVVRLVVVRGLRLAAAGAVVGVAAALALTRFIEGLLFEVSSTDPPTFALVLATLVLAATVACLVPARRASRMDPQATLRAE